ncbi:MAG: DUF4199 domain-containing protein [Paludibacter sp.]
MEQSMKKTAMTNGLIIGGMLSLKFLLSTINSGIISIVTFSISIIIIFALYRLATRYRDNECVGIINYSRAFSFIFQVYFYGSIVSSLVTLIYAGYINKEYLDAMINEVLKVYDSINFPIDDNVYSLMETINKPAPFALLNLFSSAIVAAFWGLILAAFVKKDKSIFE